MDYVEVEGSSIDDAIERALTQLGVAREKAEIEIVSDATRGLFGLGGRKARVRATLRSPLTIGSEPGRRSGDAAVEEAQPNRKARPGVESRPAADERPARVEATPVPLDDESFERARSVLAEITRRMGIEASVETVREPDGPRLALTGDTSGILIGRRGQTLDALEYLVNRIVARGEEYRERIVVDSENYRIRRHQSLEELARQTATRVRERGKPVTLNPMSPRDRRIVHLTLQEEPGVMTRSSGTGFFRKLMVLPASSARNRSGGGRRHD